MLQVLESKYGESVSILDMTGVKAKPLQRRLKNRDSKLQLENGTTPATSSNQTEHEEKVKSKRKPATDSRNPAYCKCIDYSIIKL